MIDGGFGSDIEKRVWLSDWWWDGVWYWEDGRIKERVEMVDSVDKADECDGVGPDHEERCSAVDDMIDVR